MDVLITALNLVPMTVNGVGTVASGEPLDEVQRDREDRHDQTPVDERPNRRMRLLAVTVASVVLVAVAGVVLTNHGSSHVEPVGPPRGAVVATTTSSSLPADAPSCRPDVNPPINGIGQAGIPTSYSDDNITSHFGDRFNAMWDDYHRPELGNNQRVMIAATNITDADRAWAATVPVENGHVQLVDARYSAAHLEDFAARMATKISRWSLPEKYVSPGYPNVGGQVGGAPTTIGPIPDSVYPKGLFNVTGETRRSDGTELSGEKVVSISVMHCSPALIGQAIATARAVGVPLDALQIYEGR